MTKKSHDDRQLTPETSIPGCSEKYGPITWETDITLLSNPLFVKQLFLVAVGAGLLMAIILTSIFALTGEYDAIPVMLMISLICMVGLAVMLVLVTLIVFGNRTRVRFTVDKKGTCWESIDKRARSLNRAAVLAGILRGSLAAAGAGTLALSREKEFVSWSRLARFEEDRRHLMIVLRNNWRPVMMLICLPENFETVLDYVKRKVPGSKKWGGTFSLT